MATSVNCSIDEQQHNLGALLLMMLPLTVLKAPGMASWPKTLLASLLLSLFCNFALAAPSADLWPRWQSNDPESRQVIDHSPWNELLMQHVRRGDDNTNRVDYASVNDAQRARLSDYIQQLAQTRISECNSHEQKAYWINLYNALTVQVILQHYPVSSIRDIDISPGLFTSGPWGKKLITIEGESLSLDDIEHRILRPIWMDPRIHYALNCASIGCPDLAPKAFAASTLDADLDAAARSFINHPRAVKVDGASAKLSSIYDWFKSDFGDQDAALIEHLRTYAAPLLREQLLQVRAVSEHHYDWALNRP
ncbi:MAG: hypothetical protein ACI8W7_004886 [Gammaproteobacteria bacterium]|jgi:hypothetical protein